MTTVIVKIQNFEKFCIFLVWWMHTSQTTVIQDSKKSLISPSEIKRFRNSETMRNVWNTRKRVSPSASLISLAEPRPFSGVGGASAEGLCAVSGRLFPSLVAPETGFSLSLYHSLRLSTHHTLSSCLLSIITGHGHQKLSSFSSLTVCVSHVETDFLPLFSLS